MSLNEVTAETPVRAKGELEVHRTLRTERTEICAVERFLENIKAQILARSARDREAATIYCYAVAYANLPGEAGCGDFQFCAALIPAQGDDRADFFDEAGEHFPRIATNLGEASRLSEK